MPLPESGVKLVIESADAQAAVDDLISSLDDLQGTTYTASLEIEADNSDALDAIEDLPLDGESVNFTVEAEVDLTGEELPVDGETINTELDVEETDTAKESLNALNTLKNLKIIETIWNITGTAVDILGNIKDFAVDPLLSVEDAVAKINAQTHNGIPDAERLVKGIFYDDLGDSIDQVGNLIIKAGQLKLPVEEATRAALEFTHTFQDANPEEVLDTLNQMVIGKLAPNFTEAGDLLVRAFQNGANRGNDLLRAVGDNAIAIHDLGLDGPEALSFISTGLDAGFKSAQDVLTVLLKIKQNVTNAAGNATSDVSKTLKQLGIANPSETGEAWSAEFFTAVIDKIKNAPGLTDTEREAMFTNLVGGKQGAKTFSSFLEISPEQAKTIFSNVTGAASDAATEIDNSLSGAINDFMLAAQKAATEFLSSEQIDLPGKIAALKEGLQGALNSLAEGGTLGEALTIALKPIGFDDEFQVLEQALGNFVIGILQAVAQIQDITGHGKEAEGTRATIAGLSGDQLAFNLKLSNPDEIADEIGIAVSRGVTPDDITTAVGTAVDELVKNGALAQAQALLDQFTASNPNLQVAQGLNGEQLSQADVALREGGDTLKKAMEEGIVVDVTPNFTPEAKAALQDAIDDAMEDLNPTMEVAQKSITDTTQPIIDLSTQVSDVGNNATTATPSLDALASGVDKMGGQAKSAASKVDAQADATYTVVQAADSATGSLTGMVGALDQVIGKANQLDTAASKVASDQGALDAANAADPGKHAAGGQFIGTGIVGDAGAELVSSDTGLAVWNNATTNDFLAALQSYIPGGHVNNSGGNNYTAVNNNIVQSQAQADMLGYKTASTLRGMADA